jgi:hypothetical protein
MKTKSRVAIAGIVLLVIAWVAWLVYPIESIGVATVRHEPEILNDSRHLVCLFCTDFRAGDYVTFWQGEQYLIERVSAVEGDTLTVSGATGSQVISTEEVNGRLFR